jgi:hypothetical protein
MDIFIYDVPTHSKETRLQRAIAERLHTRAYARYHGNRPGQLNFRVSIMQRTNQRTGLETAKLTVPSVEVGE